MVVAGVVVLTVLGVIVYLRRRKGKGESLSPSPKITETGIALEHLNLK